MELRWNARYEIMKPRLIRVVRALANHSGEDDGELAGHVLAAVGSLPTLGEHRGGVRIVDHAARDAGDSEFVYSLSIGRQGLELSYHEDVMMDEDDWDRGEYAETLVHCPPDHWEEEEDDSSDEEALANMRQVAEMMVGPMSDEEWQSQVDAACLDLDLVPNGMRRWLEMLPVDEDESSFGRNISIEWREE